MKHLTASHWSKLFTSFIISYLAGFVGSLCMSASSLAWYATLSKPSFAPPAWVFGPVWVVLYALIGIALFRVWTSHDARSKGAMRLFGLNIALNALWPLLFFGMRSPGLGYVEIVVLWVSLAVLVIDTWKFDRVASVLLIPYLLWITIASILNFFVWFIN